MYDLKDKFLTLAAQNYVKRGGTDSKAALMRALQGVVFVDDIYEMHDYGFLDHNGAPKVDKILHDDDRAYAMSACVLQV